MIRVLFFGPVAEQVDARDMQFEFFAGMCLQDIVVKLQEKHAQAFQLVSFIAVNQVQIRDMQLALNDHDEIAFMAKFSGG